MGYKIKTFKEKTPVYHETYVKKFTDYLKDCFIAVNYRNLYKSTDGINWTSTSLSFSGTTSATASAWSPELKLLVVVSSRLLGSNSVIASTRDGIDFNYVTIGTVSFSDVTWSPELKIFVAVGINICYTSTDGVNWTSRTVESRSWTSVTWSSSLSLFVSVSSSGTSQRVMYSSDGITWNKATLTGLLGANSASWTCVKWISDLSLFVAIADKTTTNARIMISSNGTSWSESTLPANADTDWSSLAWSPLLGKICAVSYTKTSPGGNIILSSNGVNWTLSGTYNREWRSVAWSDELSLFVATNYNDYYAMYSSDGINWTETTSVQGNVIWI